MRKSWPRPIPARRLDGLPPLREVAATHGLLAKKSLGQNFLFDLNLTGRIARAAGIEASGPWAGDTIFMRARRGEFDVVVAQYHDQGLIPVKYLGVEEGVNVTIGLPFIRTSPDHGTAFDIAGTGTADPASLIAALRLAGKLARRASQARGK